MLNTLKTRKKDEGFTIIEVLIVLAIAGLILLIVFLAVPALQRNARNTTLKSDASATVAGIGEYTSNNNGALPTGVTGSGGAYQFTGGVSSSFKTNGSTTVAGAVAGTSAAAPSYDNTVTTPTAAKINNGQIWVVFKQDCTPALNNRAVAVYYVVEGSNTVTCVQS